MEAHANYPNCAPQCPWKGTYSGSTLVSQEAHFYGIGGRELAVYSLNGSGGATQTATKVYFKGKMVGVNGNAFVADRLGSLRYSNGQAVSFYPYGEDKGTPAANDQVKFATYTRDSVDLYDYADQRYYYSGWGRFLSPDPYSGSMDPANPQSWNRYSYLLGDPVNSIDPTGLAEVCEMDTPICTGGDPYPTTVDISPFAFDPTSGFSMFSDNPPPAFNSPIQLVASQVFDETGALTYTTTWIQVTDLRSYQLNW
jgi:RHS repeat-associated protein